MFNADAIEHLYIINFYIVKKKRKRTANTHREAKVLVITRFYESKQKE